jgi:hypothetical protein
MNIRETFLKLTSRTYPHGKEQDIFDLLPESLEMDEFGNLFIQIGESDTMFTSHLDTATSTDSEVIHILEDNIIKTDGKTILGADDKAGVTIMLYMIEKGLPGLYYFFLGEEVGCIGSKKLADKYKTQKLDYIKKVVSFDRRGTDSVITFQASQRCCSDTFAKELANQLNLSDTTFKYSPDPTGVYTDSAQFVSIYPECTNISVGYYSEHTSFERQDILHLERLSEAVTKIDWNSLPVERDPSTVEYEEYGYYGRYATYDDYPDWGEYVGSNGNANCSKKPKETKTYFFDRSKNYVSSFTVDDLTGEYTAVDLCDERISKERDFISEFLDNVELSYQYLTWDGLKLNVFYEHGRSDATRKDLIEYVPFLDLSKLVENEEDSRRDMNLTYAYGD